MAPVEGVTGPEVSGEPESRPGGIPLYLWVIGAVVLAIPAGLAWGDGATRLNLLPSLIIRALGALAAPLVVLAILSAIVSNDIRGRQGALMMVYYLINTLVAMAIGLLLTNLIRPGLGAELIDLAHPPAAAPDEDRDRPAGRADPPERRRRVRAEQPGATGLADPRPGDRAGQDPQRAAGAGRDDLSRGRRPAEPRLRALDAGPALGRRAGAAGGLRCRGVERRPEGGARCLPAR